MSRSPQASTPESNDNLPKRATEAARKVAPENTDHRTVDRSKLTPMMQHFAQLKDQYSHAVLLYRVGDFYETFFQDARIISEALELVLTSKEAGKGVGRVPMTGVPHHALDRYSTMLVEKGYAIAICDQVEDASVAAKEGRQVRREVTRVLTPGTLMEEEMLHARRNNFLAAVVIAKNHWGLAYADISTGEFLTTQDRELDLLVQELMRLQPSEVLIPTNAPDLGSMLRPGQTSESLPDCLPNSFCYALRPQRHFTLAEARQRLLEQFRVRSLEGLGCEHLPLGVRAAGGLLEYLKDTQKENYVALQILRTYTIADYLILDHQTRRNLEITATVRDNTFNGSLLWALDRTSTAMGGRALRRWLLQPLLEIKGIRARHDTIAELVDNTGLRQDLQQLLRKIYDLERLTGKASSGRANARDLVALGDSLLRLPELADLAAYGSSPYLKVMQNVPPQLEELGHTLQEHLVESPPLHLTEGKLIRPQVNQQLDEMRGQAEEDQQWIANLEVTEREKTDIPKLKVGFNKTFGYYISVPRAKTAQVPDNYIRKQTLVNEERYITPELKEREARILTAREDLNRLEYEIFVGLRHEVGLEADRIRGVSRAVAALDVLCGLAEVAVYQGYCRPYMDQSREIRIIDGRHPVVEQSLPSGLFVPNSASLGQNKLQVDGELKVDGELNVGRLKVEEELKVDGELKVEGYSELNVESSNEQSDNEQPDKQQPDNEQPANLQPDNEQPANLQPDNEQPANEQPANEQPSNLQPDNEQPSTETDNPDLIILTGPNASGKSCYLRQVGLIQLMAQVGSFVPASEASLGICDRIFTRVGAVDDLATGQSTFMVEMNETANILNHATDKSLVLLDEIGRGTATFDGLSIAWAVGEYLAMEIKARTIFATHYHELNELASILPNVANYQVTVKELANEIIFLHQVQPGGANRSYGIEAGRLAGLPTSVINRAKQVMKQIEKHSKIALGLRKGIGKQLSARNTTGQKVSDQEITIEQLDIFDD
ncbi:DNA mismatch repair protein MutS [Moorena producens PAL-8-15-08-1]|uniref:DNA mismatch repair protein MutS n=1 Tax=Moorena producens PAL-8-15-08-1 TaxID=1458985 RepID=A0A1D8TYL2_9CYAN|nr:DNA mismatch repair protein MutS [Moorena producens]AOX02741.1 DNA mismatch repair protein MutS [Moorena producens PAL-8-15-08-1]